MSNKPFLQVNCIELAQALKILRKFIKFNSREEAIISFEDGTLMIGAVGMRVTASAKGIWPGQARVASSYILHIAKSLPATDPLPLRVEEGRMHIANYSVPCIWQDVGTNVIQLPMDPPLATVLGVRLRYTDDEIAQSGLTEVVRVAEERRDALIAKAVNILSVLGIQPVDLRRIIDERLKEVDKP